MPRAVLYAGPSAWGIGPDSFARAGVQLHPPARRGDIDALVAQSAVPGVAIVCDGVFQCAPALSHAELYRALQAGWNLWGVSSLGAIRAWEMRDEGMRGFGEVYAMFDRFDDFTDDEMCLLHLPEPPWFPASEALVNVRYGLEQRGRTFGIGAAAGAIVIDALRELWFGDRTEERIRAVMTEGAGIDPATVTAFLCWLRLNRVKTIDLRRLLQCRPWLPSCDGAGRH